MNSRSRLGLLSFFSYLKYSPLPSTPPTCTSDKTISKQNMSRLLLIFFLVSIPAVQGMKLDFRTLMQWSLTIDVNCFQQVTRASVTMDWVVSVLLLHFLIQNESLDCQTVLRKLKLDFYSSRVKIETSPNSFTITTGQFWTSRLSMHRNQQNLSSMVGPVVTNLTFGWGKWLGTF